VAPQVRGAHDSSTLTVQNPNTHNRYGKQRYYNNLVPSLKMQHQKLSGIAVVSFRLPSWIGKRGRMETFTLVVILWLAPDEPWGWGYREARTPGLGLDECMAAAKLVKPPQGRARCYLEGRARARSGRPTTTIL